MDSETGLEESMWQVRLEPISPGYPKRPYEPNCSYYIRTGYCGYGDRCRFHHPRDRSVCVDFRQVFGGGRTGGGEYPERVGQPACKYFLKTGTCKYGSSCKYDHPRQGAGSARTVPLNFCGYPLRLGERECAYYMRTGKCKFGLTCKFHHPEPTVFPAPYIQPPYGSVPISTGVVPVQGWNPYPPTVNPLLSPGGQHDVQTGSLFSSSNPLPLSASAFPRPNTEVPSSTDLLLHPIKMATSSAAQCFTKPTPKTIGSHGHKKKTRELQDLIKQRCQPQNHVEIKGALSLFDQMLACKSQAIAFSHSTSCFLLSVQ